MIRISRRLPAGLGFVLAILLLWGIVRTTEAGSEGPARLVHDFFPGESSGSDGLGQLTKLGDVLYFVADDLDTGGSVWRSDGTPAGTQRVSFPGEPAFAGRSNILGRVGSHVLWLTYAEGNPSGRLVSAGRRGDGVVLRTYPPNADTHIERSSILNGRLYFQDCTAKACTIVSTDGTLPGTGPVPALASFMATDQRIFGTFANRWLVFRSESALYAYDVPQNRVLLLLPEGARGPFSQIYPIGDTLFILTWHDRAQLWVSRLNAPLASQLFVADRLRVVGWSDSRLYFTKNGRLWWTDGRREGTRPYPGLRVKPYRTLANQLGALGPLTFIPNWGYSRGSLLTVDENRQEVREVYTLCRGREECELTDMSSVTIAGDLAFLAINFSLWQSDGTPKGTKPHEVLADVNPYTFQVIDGRLLLSAVSREGDLNLWETDGTVNGTHALADGDLNRPFRAQGPPIPFSGALYVPAIREPVGEQLWRVADGRATPVTNLRHLARSFDPHLAVPVGDHVIIRSHTSGGWVGLAKDGSTEKLPVYEDNCSGPWEESSCPLRRVLLSRRLLFVSNSSLRLQSTDGTAAGTVALPPFPATLGRWGDRALILDQNGGLWTSDGSSEGTRYFAQLPTDPLQIEREYPVGRPLALGSLAVLFRRVPVDDELEALELWRTDGTQAGTLRLVSFSFDKNLTPVPNPVLAGGRLFFQFQGTLWMSDGSITGTRPIPNPLPGATFALAAGTTTLYAATDQSDEGPQTLWAIDPVTFQRSQLETSYPVGAGYFGIEFGSLLGDALFFHAMGENNVFRWWVTDGTPEGTRLLPEPLARSETFFTAGDRRYFKACDSEHGCELWSTDHLGEDTRLVQDLWPGPRGSDPEILAVTDDAIWFAATEPGVGRELWKIDL